VWPTVRNGLPLNNEQAKLLPLADQEGVRAASVVCSEVLTDETSNSPAVLRFPVITNRSGGVNDIRVDTLVLAERYYITSVDDDRIQISIYPD